MDDMDIPHADVTSKDDVQASIKACGRWFFNKRANKGLTHHSEKFQHQLEVFLYLYPPLLRARWRVARWRKGLSANRPTVQRRRGASFLRRGSSEPSTHNDR